MVIKILWLFFLVFFATGCTDQNTQESSDSDVVIDMDHSDVDHSDVENDDADSPAVVETPDITSAVSFMENFKAADGGYGQMFDGDDLIGVTFWFWNNNNNADTCSNEFLSPEPTGSYMSVEGLMQVFVTINGYAKGEYKIIKHAESDFYSTDENLATVRSCVWHEEELQPGFEDCYIPYSGAVIIDKDVPSSVKESKDVKINVKIDADFPEESLRLVECNQYGKEVDGEVVEWELCTCRADDGVTSDCEPTYSGENCCYNPDSKLVNFKVMYDTFVCHLYCSRTHSGGPTDKCNPD